MKALRISGIIFLALLLSGSLTLSAQVKQIKQESKTIEKSTAIPKTKVEKIGVGDKLPMKTTVLDQGEVKAILEKWQYGGHTHNPGSSSTSGSSEDPAIAAKRAFLKRWADANCGNNTFYAGNATNQQLSTGYRVPTDEEMKKLLSDYKYSTGTKDGKSGLWIGNSEEDLDKAMNSGRKDLCVFLPLMGWIDDKGNAYSQDSISGGAPGGYYYTSSKDSDGRYIAYNIFDKKIYRFSSANEKFKFLVRSIKK